MVFLLLEIPSLGLSLIFNNMGYRVVSFIMVCIITGYIT
jgi:hypothetical protein